MVRVPLTLVLSANGRGGICPMKRVTPFLLFLSLSLQCFAVAAARDFYGNTKYRGPKARPGVGLYKVTQPDDADPQKHIPREVHWFPRRGLDFVPLEADMPLRTWTFRPDGPRRAYDQPKQFKAHLIGFRGIGNTVSNAFLSTSSPGRGLPDSSTSGDMACSLTPGVLAAVRRRQT